MDTEERSRLFSQLCLAESRRSDLRTNISVLNSQIELLRTEEHAISLEITRLTNTHSACNWLPNDILREIFLWCIGDDLEVDIPFWSPEGEDGYDSESHSSDNGTDTGLEPDGDGYMLRLEESAFQSNSLKEPPPPQQLILSHVCSRWRHVSLSTRELWSGVFITQFDARSKRLANEWLSKAASYPVSISISFIASNSNESDSDSDSDSGSDSDSDSDSASNVEFDVYTELRDFLSAYRIGVLDLPVYSKTWPQLSLIFSELPDENISRLEKLSLTDLDDDGGQGLLLLNSARYPRLHFLELSGLFDPSFILPWNSLRELDTTSFYLPYAQCLYILRQCTLLHTCSFGVKVSSGIQYEPVHHTNLSVLLLHFINPAPIDIALLPLTIPNLSSLTIDRGCFDTFNKRYSSFPLLRSGFEAEYLSLIQRSEYPCIQHLSITYTDFAINIANLLVASPTLTRLTIAHVAFGQTTLNNLAGGQLGPSLQHLGVVKLSDASLREFLDMILSRNSEQAVKESTMPFRSVELLDNRLDDTDLMALREAGVEPKAIPFPSCG